MQDDKVMPVGKWEFNEEVTDVFDNMLARSIPDYEIMRKLTFDIGKHFINGNSIIIDLGCSRGESIKPFEGLAGHIIGLEISDSMIDVARKNFSNNSKVEIKKCDIAHDFPDSSGDLILSILTLQFTPIEYRASILKNVYNHLNTNGAFIIVEKVLGEDAAVDNLLVDCYYDMKMKADYTQEQIQAKRKSLEGVLVPLTSDWNVSVLKAAGFNTIECFWRCLNFSGWLALK